MPLTTKSSARTLIAAAAATFGFGIAIPAAAAATPAPRGDASTKCTIPAPPTGAKKLTQSRSNRVLRQTCKSKKISASDAVLTTRIRPNRWATRPTLGRWNHEWRLEAGQRLGLTMRNKACGNLKIDAGSQKGKPTYFFVCRGKTSTTATECSYYG